MIEFKIIAETADEFLSELAKAARQMTAPLAVIPQEAPILAQAAQDQAIKEPVRKPRAGKADAKPATEEASKGAETLASETPKVDEGKAAETAPTAGAEPSTEKTPATAAAEQPKAETGHTAAAVLDFDKDVAPLVLGYVKSHGKPWVMDVLSEFGVARASELAPERFDELVAALNDKAAA